MFVCVCLFVDNEVNAYNNFCLFLFHLLLIYCVATGVTTMAQGHKFQDLEETGEALVAFINSSQPEKLRHIRQEHQALFDQHIETKKFVTQILKG